MGVLEEVQSHGFDIAEIQNAIVELSKIDADEITPTSVADTLLFAIDHVLAYTQREVLNDPLRRVCSRLTVLNWLKRYFAGDDAESALTVGDVLSISEGDTRIAYQNKTQMEGFGVSYGSFMFEAEAMSTILRRYRRIHWGSKDDVDYG